MALDGKRTGPFSKHQLVDKLAPLSKNADVHIWNEKLGDWKPPGQVPGGGCRARGAQEGAAATTAAGCAAPANAAADAAARLGRRLARPAHRRPFAGTRARAGTCGGTRARGAPAAARRPTPHAPVGAPR